MEILRHGGKKFVRHAVSLLVETVFSQTFVGNELVRRPGIRKIPLPATFMRAHNQATWLFKRGKMLHECAGLFGCCNSRPQREKRDRKSTRLNSSHANISYAVFCL